MIVCLFSLLLLLSLLFGVKNAYITGACVHHRLPSSADAVNDGQGEGSEEAHQR